MPKNVKGFLSAPGKWIYRGYKWIVDLMKSVLKVNLAHNTGTKLLSLVLAVLFWFFVMDQVDPEITRVFENVPVQLINVQELDQNNLKIMNQHDFLVNVEVSGRRNNVLNMNSKSIYLWADMRTIRSGSNTVYINRTINSESVSIKSVLPNDIVITAERIISLPKPVKVLTNDKYSETFYQEGIIITPEEIKVMGPESLVNSVAYLGAYINVGTLTTDLERDVSLVPYSADGEIVSGVTLEMSYASMQLKLGKKSSLSVKSEVIGEPKEGYKVVEIRTIPERIELNGPIDTLDSLGDTIVEMVTLNGDEETSFILEKELVLPAGVTVKDGTRVLQIEVLIEPVQTKEFIFEAREIPIVNLSEALKTNLLDSEAVVTIKVTDIQSVVTNLSKSDLKLDLNFTNVDKPGVYRMKVNVNNSENYSEVIVEPTYVEVTVTDKEEGENP